MENYEKPFLKMLETHVSDVISAGLLKKTGQVKIKIPKISEELQGATGSILAKVNCFIKFVIKYQKNEKEIKREKNGHDLLMKGYEPYFKKHIIPILFPKETYDLIIIEPFLNDSVTLHSFIRKRKYRKKDLRWAKEVYKNFLEENLTLWRNTPSGVKPDLNKTYLGRIFSRKKEIKKTLGLKYEFLEYKLYFNSKEYVIKDLISLIGNILSEISKKVTDSYLIHGDEHADNILLKKINLCQDIKEKIEDWSIIDYTNVTNKGDWIQSICKMLHWWIVYYRIKNIRDGVEDNPNFEIRVDNTTKSISFNYARELKTLYIYKELIDITHDFVFNSANKYFKEDETNILKRIGIGLFTLFLGAISRHQEKDKKFAIPILLGESIHSLIDYRLIDP